MRRDLEVAIYFRDISYGKLPFPVFMPERPILGKVNEDTSMFTDYFSGQTYINTDLSYGMGLPDGFNYSIKLKKLKKKRPFKKIADLYRNYWLSVEKYLYVYDIETGRFCQVEKEQIEEKTGVRFPIELTEDINKLNEAYVNGDEETIEQMESKYDEEDNIDTEILEIKIPISEAISLIKRDIKAQDEAVKRAIIAIYRSFKLNDPLMKSNVLIIGPTGSGKTALVRAIGKVFNYPVCIEDMTRYTDTGYKGLDIDSIIIHLVSNADFDIKKAERSILFLDEVDKKADNDKGTNSFNKSDVLKSLLKLTEGGMYTIQTETGQIDFDTSNLVVIAGGAFSDLYKQEVKMKPIGFEMAEESKTNEEKAPTIKALEKYGMPIEFLGRFKTIIKMRHLTIDDLIAILKTSELSSLKKYIEMLNEKGINLKVSDDLYRNIAEEAYKLGTGARALNVIVDELFEDILYDLFDECEIESEIDLESYLKHKEKTLKLEKPL